MIRVLLVDDEYYFRQALKRIVDWEGLGYQIVAEAANGEDALTAMTQVDLVFLDINIPIKDGLTVLQESVSQGNRAKVIMVTVYSEFNYIKQAMKLGALDYLLKPVDKAELLAVLARAKKIIQQEHSQPSETAEAMPAVQQASSKSNRLVEAAKQYIYENYADPSLRMSTIAQNLYINYHYLSKLFSKVTGTTLSDYLTNYRIEKAKELIDSGYLSLQAIAARCGYEDANYFSKCFKKKYGISPSAYMESISERTEKHGISQQSQ